MWNGPWGWGLGVEVAVDRGSGDAELGGDFGDGVEVTALLVGLVVHLPGRPGLAGAELWFLAAGTAAGPGGGESVSGAFGHEGVFDYLDKSGASRAWCRSARSWASLSAVRWWRSTSRSQPRSTASWTSASSVSRRWARRGA